jgi:hypothetical protein
MKRNETGLLILVCAGLVFAFGDLLIPQENLLFAADKHPTAFANLVTTGDYKMWAFRGFIGVLLEMFGTVTLYIILSKTKVERIAFWGLILSLCHHIIGFGVFAVAYYMFPAVGELILSGNTEVVKFVAIEGDLAILFASSLGVTLIGLGVMAVAITKSGVLPRMSGWAVLLGFALIPVPGVIIQFIANFIWAAAYFWMWMHLTRTTNVVREELLV